MGRNFETRRLVAILDINARDVQERYSFDHGQIHGERLAPPDGIGVQWRFDTLTDAAPENDAEWVLTEIMFTTRNDEGGEIALYRTGEFTGDEQWGAVVDFNDSSAVRRLAARACYCLTVEDEASWESLEYQLSAHEKLELRFSMPREFWPKSGWMRKGSSRSISRAVCTRARSQYRRPDKSHLVTEWRL